ncbi:MAG: YigZ family protein [Chitinophagales bacterium]
MSEQFSYKTINQESESLFKDRSSKFYGYIFPIENEDEIKNYLEVIQQKHPKARHHCYAYRLGLDGNNERANDAGEPNGSAGLPILNQLKSFEITNVLAIVVRYFGGTKLGVPGLINAYKEATQLAITDNNIIEKELYAYFTISTQYENANYIFQLIGKFEGKIIEQTYLDESKFEIEIPLRLKLQFLLEASSIHVLRIEEN